MKDPQHHDPVNVVGEAYELMLERAVENFHKLEDKAGPAFHTLIDAARDKAVTLGELSREESHKVATYINRDLHDAAAYIAETGRDVKTWFGFETRVVEDRLLELFARAADRTTLELIKFKQKAEQASEYHTGQLTGPGTLVCDACAEHLHFHAAGKIPPCPKCHKTSFHRMSVNSD